MMKLRISAWLAGPTSAPHPSAPVCVVCCQDPDKFAAEVEADQAALRQKLIEASKRLKSVAISRELKLKIAQICSNLGVDGIRGDMTVNRAAKAYVALEGRTEVTLEDVGRVITLCLNHR
jgi:magnesium chelatase subunit I